MDELIERRIIMAVGATLYIYGNDTDPGESVFRIYCRRLSVDCIVESYNILR